MAALRLKTAADPTGASPLGLVPQGRHIAGGFFNPKYGGGFATMPDSIANPNVPMLGQPAPTTAEPVADTAEPPVSPDVDAGIAEDPPESPNLANPSNIVDFPAVDESEPFAQPVSDADEAEAFFAAQRAEHDAFEKRRAALQPEIDAAVNGEAGPAPATPASRPAAVAPPVGRSLNDFRKDAGTPITFKSKAGAAWNPGDEVGFNDAAMENANPDWTGGASWTPRSSLNGPYETAGTAVGKREPSEQTQRFYERAYARGDNRRVNRFNNRMMR